MTVYYNEFNKHAAQWLRNLIAAGVIAPGVVDERSIEDVRPSDLHGYTQCHFFAGVGVWSYALRRTGWRDDRSIWTASCPCQPFSAAGQGAGFADERHLWPAFLHLVSQCRPTILTGEQVASKDADPWLDLVQTDLEALGYAFGAVAFPSAGVGAPHIRDRTYWVADADSGVSRQRGKDVRGRFDGSDAKSRPGLSGVGVSGGLDNPHLNGRQSRHAVRSLRAEYDAEHGSGAIGLADTQHDGYRRQEGNQTEQDRNRQDFGLSDRGHPLFEGQPATGPTNGIWSDADWLFCRDGKWRPVEPGTFPLAHGAASRVGRLRAYGNAINAEAARVFIEVIDEIVSSPYHPENT